MANYLIQFWRNARRRARDAGGKPAHVQVFETLQLAIVRKLGPRYYETAGLWRRHIDRRTRFGHINAGEYRTFLDRMNPALYRKASQHKMLEKSMLTTLAVPTAGFIAYVLEGLPSSGKQVGDAASLESTLSDAATERFVLKEVEGHGGRSFQAFTIERQTDGILLRSLKDGVVSSPQALWDNTIAGCPNGFIVESYIEQHPWYTTLNSSSINTFRVWVIEREGHGEVVLSYLRMGRAGDLVDNKTAGGLLAPVTHEGKLGMATDAGTDRREFASHPDSGTAIAGAVPPLLVDVHAAAIRALSAFPNARFAGVDVAVSVDGPVIVELNLEPAREGAVRCDIPFKLWLAKNGF